MFSREFSAVSLESATPPKVIKLVKDPIDINYIKIHVKFGSDNLAYLVMQTAEIGTLGFYARGVYAKIASGELSTLFQDVQKGWARIATPEQHAIMAEASEHLSYFLSTAEENPEACENCSTCGL
jgi:hypothetical protein